MPTTHWGAVWSLQGEWACVGDGSQSSRTYGCAVPWQRKILFPNKQTGLPSGRSLCECVRLVCGRFWEVKLETLEPWAVGSQQDFPLAIITTQVLPVPGMGTLYLFSVTSVKTNSFQTGRVNVIHPFPPSSIRSSCFPEPPVKHITRAGTVEIIILTAGGRGEEIWCPAFTFCSVHF